VDEEMDKDKEIYQFVKKVRFRLAWQEILDKFQTALAGGLLAGLVISLFSLLVPFYYAPHLEIVLILLCVPAAVITGLRSAPDMTRAALAADEKGHKERISTALYLAGSENPFAGLQKKDALASIAGFQIRKEFPFWISRKRALLAFLLALLFLGSCFLESPSRQRAADAHAQRERVKEAVAEIEKVEDVLDELKENRKLSESEIEKLKEQLKLSKEKLSDAETIKELQKEQERLARKLADAGSSAKNKTLAETLGSASQSTKQLQEKNRQAMLKEAQDALDKAENGSGEDKENAYEKLSELAEMTGDQALQNAVENYRNSNYAGPGFAAARSALNQTAGMMAGSYSMAGNPGSSQDGSPNASVSQSGRPSADNRNNGNNGNGSGSGQGNGSQNGQSNQNGSKSGSGSGQGNQGNGSGNGSSGSGSGSGNGNGGQGGGSGSGNGGGWNYGSKVGREGAAKVDESITVPEGVSGDDENLTGQTNGNESSSYVKSSQSQSWAGSKVSYGSVSGEYKEKAYRKLDGASYPDRLKEQIRDYFDGLN